MSEHTFQKQSFLKVIDESLGAFRKYRWATEFDGLDALEDRLEDLTEQISLLEAERDQIETKLAESVRAQATIDYLIDMRTALVNGNTLVIE